MEDAEALRIISQLRTFVAENNKLPRQSQDRKRTGASEQALSRKVDAFKEFWLKGDLNRSDSDV